MYTRRKGRTRTAGLTLAVFAAGAGIGWTFADLLFGATETAPVVASIHFEDAHLDAIPAPPLYNTFIAVPPFPSRPQASAPHQDNAGPPDEERRLTQAMQWAERYRQRRDASARVSDTTQRREIKVAAAEGNQWTDVADQANRVRQPQADLRQLIRAQGEQRNDGAVPETKVAAISGLPQIATPRPASHVKAAHCESCGRKPVHARRIPKARSAGRHTRSVARATSGFICPLRWLEAAFTSDRRRMRRYAG